MKQPVDLARRFLRLAERDVKGQGSAISVRGRTKLSC